MSEVENNIAKIISWMFHPLLMPLLIIFLLFQTNTYIKYAIPFENKMSIYSIILINTCIVPVFITLFLLKKGIIKSLYMETQYERWYPFAITAIFYFLTYYILKEVSLPQVIYSSILAATLSVILVLMINVIWKISIHSIGIGGVIGAMVAISERFVIDLNLIIIGLILVAGLIGFARLKLKSHQPLEIYAGFVLGFLCEWVFILWDIG